MAKIKSPVEGYNGVVVGVSFHKGEAETDNELALNYFARQGYTIDGDSESGGGNSAEAESRGDLESLGAKELKARAKALDLPVGGTKAELVTRIAEAEAVEAAGAKPNTDQARDAADLNADGIEDAKQDGEVTPSTPAEPAAGSVREV